MPYLTGRCCEGCGRSFTPGVDGPSSGYRCNGCSAQQKAQKNLDDYQRRKDDPVKKLYHTANWKRLREAFLRQYPICQKLIDDWSPGVNGARKIQCSYPAKELHHLVDPYKDVSKFFDWPSIRGLCKHHHHKAQGEPEGSANEYVPVQPFSMEYSA